MCRTRSGEAVKQTRNRVKLFLSQTTDSHSEIRVEFGLNDDHLFDGRNRCPVEFVPTTDLFDLDTWKFRFDEHRPDWWTDGMTDQCVRSFRDDLRPKLDAAEASGQWAGNLDLSGTPITSLGALTSVGGYLHLSGTQITDIPDGVVNGKIYY